MILIMLFRNKEIVFINELIKNIELINIFFKIYQFYNFIKLNLIINQQKTK